VVFPGVSAMCCPVQRGLGAVSHGSRAAVGLALVGALLLGAGCSRGGGSPALHGTPARELTSAEADTVAWAEEILLSRCMSRKGLRYEATKPLASASTEIDFPYVVDDPDRARTHGYGLADQRAIRQAKDSSVNQRQLLSLTADQRASYVGTLLGAGPDVLRAKIPTGQVITRSKNGCLADAHRQLYGDVATWFQANAVASNLRPVIGKRVREDRGYPAAVSAWSACMGQLGHPVRHPDEARQQAISAYEADPVAGSAREKELATAESRCARQTDLAAVTTRLDQEYGDEVRAKYQRELSVRRELRWSALTRARQITRQG